MTEIPADFLPPLPKTDTSSRFYRNITTMCADIAYILSQFYDPNQVKNTPSLEKAAESPMSYVYLDFNLSHGDTIMFGVVCKGVENFCDEKFRVGLETYLVKEIGLAVAVPRKDWGRIISDLDNPKSNMWLFHIAIPAEYTSIKRGFIE